MNVFCRGSIEIEKGMCGYGECHDELGRWSTPAIRGMLRRGCVLGVLRWRTGGWTIDEYVRWAVVLASRGMLHWGCASGVWRWRVGGWDVFIFVTIFNYFNLIDSFSMPTTIEKTMQKLKS